MQVLVVETGLKQNKYRKRNQIFIFQKHSNFIDVNSVLASPKSCGCISLLIGGLIGVLLLQDLLAGRQVVLPQREEGGKKKEYNECVGSV